MSQLKIIQQEIAKSQKVFEIGQAESMPANYWNNEAGFAMQIISDNKYLQSADPVTIRKSLEQVSKLNISLNPALGFAYLVPRGGKCILDVSYKGMIKFLTDAGSVKSMQAHLIHENDDYRVIQGSKPELHHEPDIIKPGKVIAAYSVATFPDGSTEFLLMRMDELEKVKGISQYTKAGSVWHKWEEEMFKKTVIKRHFKTLPKSERYEAAAAIIQHDNDTNFNDKPKKDFSALIDDEAEVVEEPQSSESAE